LTSRAGNGEVPKNCLAFKSKAFNTTIEREYFINPGCFGDDVGRWLVAQLGARGQCADEKLGQEDFGWYLTFEAAGVKHQAVLGYRPGSNDDEGGWICWIERKASLVGSMLGRRKDIKPEAVEATYGILSSSPSISEVRLCSEGDAWGLVSFKTCYRPDPGSHGELTNLDYYFSEAAKQ
jgi:hypothetical protein